MKPSNRKQMKDLAPVRIPKVPCLFLFLDKFKYEIRNNVLIFVFILKLRHKTGLKVFQFSKTTKYSNLNLKFVFRFSV